THDQRRRGGLAGPAAGPLRRHLPGRRQRAGMDGLGREPGSLRRRGPAARAGQPPPGRRALGVERGGNAGLRGAPAMSFWRRRRAPGAGEPRPARCRLPGETRTLRRVITGDLDRALATATGSAGTWRPAPPGTVCAVRTYVTTIAFRLARGQARGPGADRPAVAAAGPAARRRTRDRVGAAAVAGA